MKLILASNSRTRKEVLDKVGLIYDVMPISRVYKELSKLGYKLSDFN